MIKKKNLMSYSMLSEFFTLIESLQILKGLQKELGHVCVIFVLFNRYSDIKESPVL